MNVEAINRKLNLVLFDDGTTAPMASFHDDEGDEVAPEEADFATFQFTDGKWGFVRFEEFGDERIVFS